MDRVNSRSLVTPPHPRRRMFVEKLIRWTHTHTHTEYGCVNFRTEFNFIVAPGSRDAGNKTAHCTHRRCSFAWFYVRVAFPSWQGSAETICKHRNIGTAHHPGVGNLLSICLPNILAREAFLGWKFVVKVHQNNGQNRGVHHGVCVCGEAGRVWARGTASRALITMQHDAFVF